MYIPDKNQIWIPATVLRVESSGTVVHVNVNGVAEERVIEEGVGSLPLQNAENDETVEDMCLLSHLHEAAIAYNLRDRWSQRHPYTYTGKIVLAVNPYEWYHDLYSMAFRRMYASKERQGLPPHVYAMSANAYQNMKHTKMPQSILVSGESGSGKTETVKIMMEHLATVSLDEEGEGNGRDVSNGIIEKVLKSNPLLETFGNAKTIRNDNSSRFGKFTQLLFDKKYRIIGAKCRHYLLEKSRVVQQSENERNYHIFYQLVASKDEKYLLESKSAQNFPYLNDNCCDSVEGVSDATSYDQTCQALSMIGISSEVIVDLFRALSGILHIGCIEFSLINDEDALCPPDSAALLDTANLLGMTPVALAETLCNRTVKAGIEVFSVPLNVQKASNNRDGLAKKMYAKLFAWLVSQINLCFGSTNQRYTNHIDLLDIFGFESFKTNSFEQFCINFANEKLQQKFTLDVFKTVQQEYTAEGIAWTYITFQDNQDILDLIEGRMGLISLLNEECFRPKGSDASYASKVITSHENNARLSKARLSQMHFVLHHYAGEVSYDCQSFVEKNKDSLQSDLEALLGSSTNNLIRTVFDAPPPSHHKSKTTDTGPNKSSNMMQETISTKFKNQLSFLMSDITATEVHYVRCIKPNNTKSKKEFDLPVVIEQLRCAGVVEAIRISRATFPNKMRHDLFLQRFMVLKNCINTVAEAPPMTARTASAACEALARRLLLSDGVQEPSGDPKFVMGKTNIYFAAGTLEELEDQRINIGNRQVVKIQKTARMWLQRRNYAFKYKCIVAIQSWIRAIYQLSKFQTSKTSAIQIQAHWRGLMSRKFRHRLVERKMAVKIQSRVRRNLAVSHFQFKRNAAIIIGSLVKMRRQRRKYSKLLFEKQENDKMEHKLELLNQRLEEERRAREETEARNTTLQQKLEESLQINRESMSPNATEPKSMIPDSPKSQQRSISGTGLLEESGNMLEYMHTEMSKYKEMNEQLRSENENLKAENARVKDAYTSAGASFAALNQHNKHQSRANLRLMSTHAALIKSQEDRMKKYQTQINALKDELQVQVNVYSAEVGTRAQQQEAFTEMIDLAESHNVERSVVAKMREIASQIKPPAQPSSIERVSGVGANTEPGFRATIGPGQFSSQGQSLSNRPAPVLEQDESKVRESWSAGSRASTYVDEETRRRKSKIGGMFKKMFKKEDSSGNE